MRGVKSGAWTIVVALTLTEVHSVVDGIWPVFAQRKIDLFASPDFHMTLTVQWYLKFTFEDMFLIVLSFTAAKIALKYSRKLCVVLHVIFFYQVIDLVLFYWNYKSSFQAYWLLLFTVILCIFLILRPEKKSAVIKSME